MAENPAYRVGLSPWSDAVALVGERIRVVMDPEDAEGVVIGTLVSLDSETGEFVIDTDEGRRYCWPFVEAHLDT